MDLSKILVVAGKPDIYELVSQTKNGAIVESLADKKRCPRKEEGKPITFEIKKAAGTDLFAYFKEVLPNYDTEHVHTSDVKKVLLWYNLLVNAGKIDLEEPEAEQKEEEKA